MNVRLAKKCVSVSKLSKILLGCSLIYFIYCLNAFLIGLGDIKCSKEAPEPTQILHSSANKIPARNATKISGSNKKNSFSVSTNSLKFWNILDLLPHLQGKNREFTHELEVSRSRHAKYVIGVSTIKRPGKSYLISMLKYLLRDMNQTEIDNSLIVIFIAEVLD